MAACTPWRAVLAMAFAPLLVGTAPVQSAPELAYRLDEGRNINAFFRNGSVAAHLLLRSGMVPRILVAFPAGNSGVGLWFKPLAAAAHWTLEASPQALSAEAGTLHGIVAIARIDAPRLELGEAVLSNVRVLRDYQASGRIPAEVASPPVIAGRTIRYRRHRLDGAPGYALELEVLEGRIAGTVITAGAAGHIRLRIRALTGEPALTPFPAYALLNAQAGADPAARRSLAFLSYREKFLAGSWRFNTYFGRDTLMAVRLLMPVLRPTAIETGLKAVLSRLSAGGEVAHEEGIGEFALLARRGTDRTGAGDELDYGMIDDDYMLGPVAADYLTGRGRDRARAFLALPIAGEAEPGSPQSAGALLVRNLRFVLGKAQPFADQPAARRLIAIKPGRMTGNWRDSDDGLGGGIYPYDVNAVLVPAALAAADRLWRSGLLTPYLSPDDRAAFARAGSAATVWSASAPPLFQIDRPGTEARQAIRSYAATLGVSAAPALRTLGSSDMNFHALSLDARGTPVPVVHSDEGMALLFSLPDAKEIDRYVTAIFRPFPAGLMTDAGMLVANPAFAPPALRAKFGPGAYHGTVVWSWQQALLAAGLERQLTRSDLPAPTRSVLERAQWSLWEAITATRPLRSSELWSWRYDGHRYRPAAFGVGAGDADESNAAQLWSTVYLGLRPPTRRSR